MTEPQEPRSSSIGHPSPEELSELTFSPEDAPAGLREHVTDCPACTAEVEDLRTVLASLAQLPVPAVPVSVGIRLDAAIARAWQEADAPQPEQTAAHGGVGRTSAGRSGAARRGRFWRGLALPLGALCLVILGVVGVSALFSGTNVSGGSAASSAGGAAAAPAADPALVQWARSVLPGASSEQPGPGVAPQAAGSSASRGTFTRDDCPIAPARAGYTLLTTSQRNFGGRLATLVLYQNDEEPASRPLVAVVYAGSCPTASSVILDEGVVSR